MKLKGTHVSSNDEETEIVLDLPDEVSEVTPEWIQQALEKEEQEHQELIKSLNSIDLEKQNSIHRARMKLISMAKELIQHR